MVLITLSEPGKEYREKRGCTDGGAEMSGGGDES